MTYEELLLKTVTSGDTSTSKALEAVVLLHKPVRVDDEELGVFYVCPHCESDYPCQTVWAIENILG